VAASSGWSVAPAWVRRGHDLHLPDGPIDDRDAEVSSLRAAIAEVATALEAKAEATEGELAEVLEAQATMARDPELTASAEQAVTEQDTPAARAIVDAGEGYAEALEASDSEYMAARAEDIRDVCRRVAARLLGLEAADVSAISERVIIAAAELPPADVAELDRDLIAGITTEQGSRTSHTAIVARSLGIPAVVGVEGLLESVRAETMVALDGEAGDVHVDPDEDTKKRAESMAAARRDRRAELAHLADSGPATTADGHRVELAANVGATIELRAALDQGAEGVGLLRTELLYLDRSDPPSEEEQLGALQEMGALLGDRRLVVRTFDFGADKRVDFLSLAAEENPALGVRGLRVAREHTDLLDTQLRAVLRAARDGARMAVMAPMIATVAEAEWFVERFERLGGREVGAEVGAMVEVPSAVLMSDALAERLDFLSIGTNDLTQYLHAADRQSGALAYLQDPFAPSLLRSVERICSAARDKAWVGVCGEAAGDPAWALVAVGSGVAELSMGADSILEVKAALRRRSLDQCRAVAQRALQTVTAEEARAVAQELIE
jgi:phosphotransferase system enzyme I (PtsI)